MRLEYSDLKTIDFLMLLRKKNPLFRNKLALLLLSWCKNKKKKKVCLLKSKNDKG